MNTLSEARDAARMLRHESGKHYKGTRIVDYVRAAIDIWAGSSEGVY
jgi:hypothetical protein